MSTKGTSRPRRKATPTLFSLFPEYAKKEYQQRVGAAEEKFIQELRDAYLYRGLVLYIGAGVSQSVGLPSWPELVRLLTINMMTRRVSSAIKALGALSETKYWETIAAIQREVEKNADYNKPILMMARAIKDEFGDQLPAIVSRSLYRRRIMLVRGRFVNMPSDSPKLMNAIIALARAERDVKGVQAIVNYNYDDLLDRNLREAKVRCRTVRSGHDKVPPGTLPCYHVHGVLSMEEWRKPKPFRRPNATGNFVFSEDEYHAEYSDPYRWSNMTQMSLLGRYTGLFVGLSMEDPNLRRLIDVTHRQYPEIPNYAVLPRKRSLARSKDSKRNILANLFEEVESSSFQKIGVRVIWVDDHSEIPEVLEKICTL